MNAPLRLSAFAGGLVLVFGVATAAGNAVGSLRDGAPAATGMDHGGSAAPTEPAGHGGMGGAPTEQVPGDGMTGDHAAPGIGGLAVAEGDLRLVVDEPVRPAGQEGDFRFRILGPDQQPVTDFDPEQGGVELHLIVVGRDLSGFQHLHPAMAPGGAWSIPLTLTAPGAYRAFADVTVDGRPHTLGSDLFVPGTFAPVPLPAPSTEVTADGYQVTLDRAPPVAGQEVALRFTVSRDGSQVAGLEPYLGARGHLVGLRQGDLAYLHLHPTDDPTGAAAGEIAFAGTFPSAGSYGLFLQFAHEGTVHTAALTLEVPR